MQKKFYLILLLAQVVMLGGLCAAWANAADSVMVVKYAASRVPDIRHGHNYSFELMQLVMEQTKPEYGDYRIEPYIKELDVKRQALLMSEGELINLSGTSTGTVVSDSDSIQVPYDIYRGLLGRRICLTNKESLPRFNAINNINSLKSIRIGQSMGWSDIDIYNFNKLNLIQASTFDGLLGMLAAGRFECLALGVNEVVGVYESRVDAMPNLAIESGLLIYYEYPFYFYISAKHPRLAERFKYGMDKIQKNGEFDRLFSHYFRQNLEALDIKNRRVICVKSPFIDIKNQCRNLETINFIDEKQLFKLTK